MSKQDGGPAFPVPASHENYAPTGMSLRDWFAGQALAGLFADGREGTPLEYAQDAYTWADAMLKARESQ